VSECSGVLCKASKNRLNESNMKQDPTVSVVLSSYNHEKYITKAVESIINQTYGFKNIELIAIDDCSKDNTGIILKDLSERYGFSFTQNIVNKGLVPNRNLGFKTAKGKYVCGIGSDDYWHPERLEKQVKFMEAHPQYPMTYGHVFYLKNNEIITWKHPRYRGGRLFEDLFLVNYHIPSPTYMFRKEIFDEIGLYDETLKIEDWYMNLKIAEKYEIGFIDDFLSYYRIHDNNISNNHKLLYDNQYKIIQLYRSNELYEDALNQFYIRKFNDIAWKDRIEALKLLPKVIGKLTDRRVLKGILRLFLFKKPEIYSHLTSPAKFNPLNLVYSIFPFRLLRKIINRKVIIINYHSLKNIDPDPEINKNPYRSFNEFKKDLKFIKQHFNVIGMRDFIDYQKGLKGLPKNAIVLTVDDGLTSAYEQLYPLFKEFSFPATFFVNNSFIDNHDLHFERKANLLVHFLENSNVSPEIISNLKNLLKKEHKFKDSLIESIRNIDFGNRHLLDGIASILNFSFAEYLKKNKVYLTSQEISEMIKNGMCFGGHSKEHPNFKDLDLQTQVSQAVESVLWVKENFNLDYAVYANPYTDRVLSLKFYEQIKGKIDYSFGSAGLDKDPVKTNFQRILIETTGLNSKAAFNRVYIKALRNKMEGKDSIKRN
jgi:alpha-1,3-rhamnosyltransferase